MDDYDGGYPVTHEDPSVAEGLSNSEHASENLACLMEDWQNPEYCVSAHSATPYRNRDNYTCKEWNDVEVLKSDTIEGLYEKMAKFKIDHKLLANTPDRRGEWSEDDFEVKFSDITIECEPFSEDKLKLTETWKNIGAIREAKREAEKKAAEAERIRAAEWERKRKEEHERDEYRRLKAKYGGLPT